MLLIFALTTTYSVICPLIAPFGLLYLFMKHLVDRYNIYYAYKVDIFSLLSEGKILENSVLIIKGSHVFWHCSFVILVNIYYLITSFCVSSLNMM